MMNIMQRCTLLINSSHAHFMGLTFIFQTDKHFFIKNKPFKQRKFSISETMSLSMIQTQYLGFKST